VNWSSISLEAVSPVQVGVVFVACLIAAVWDIAAHRIPNVLTLPLLGAGLAWSAWQRGPTGLLEALAASFILALPYLALFLWAKGGGGDLKLMAGIGAWTGVVCGLVVLALIALSGVALGLVMALAQRQFRAVLGRVAAVAHLAIPAIARCSPAGLSTAFAVAESKVSRRMPYGVAIFAGVCLATGGYCLWRA
jgi:prepilin peptidase CpaA